MAKPKLSLQPSEGIVVRAAATIYAAYITSGRVTPGKEETWIQQSITEAFRIARLTDEAVQSDTELG